VRDRDHVVNNLLSSNLIQDIHAFLSSVGKEMKVFEEHTPGFLHIMDLYPTGQRLDVSFKVSTRSSRGKRVWSLQQNTHLYTL